MIPVVPNGIRTVLEFLLVGGMRLMAIHAQLRRRGAWIGGAV